MSFLQRTLRLTKIKPRVLALRQANPFTSQAKRSLSTNDSLPPSLFTDAASQASGKPLPEKPLIPFTDIGKSLHPFPRYTFKHMYSPPVIPPFVLKHYSAEPFYWSWTIKAGPNAGKTRKVLTVPIKCHEDAPPAIRWTVNHFDAFRAHLDPIVLDNGNVPGLLLEIYRNNMVFQFRIQSRLYFANKANAEATEATP